MERILYNLCRKILIIILPETSEPEALILAEQAVSLAAGEVFFTVSIGVSVAESEDINIDRLIQRADLVLYEAKRAGRNRICLQTEDE